MYKLKFKNNTEFILPQFLKNSNLFKTNALFEVKIRNLGINRFIIVKYQPVSIKQIYWIYINSEKEKFFHTAYEDPENGLTIVEYIIPRNSNFIVDTVSEIGYDVLSKKQIIEFMAFWNDYSEKFL